MECTLSLFVELVVELCGVRGDGKPVCTAQVEACGLFCGRGFRGSLPVGQGDTDLSVRGELGKCLPKGV